MRAARLARPPGKKYTARMNTVPSTNSGWDSGRLRNAGRASTAPEEPTETSRWSR
ncbi:hypothetical protein GA0070616_1935 [Micromonospora nigra]|uniref:Uncharacterized protein n=1 Tax=Micromonospora nigra TaxID=145857 RepID=A0A1C6RT77_9ACTN|nr:hypothetical protein GA0070616_1935 [Micromonospora nigra]